MLLIQTSTLLFHWTKTVQDVNMGMGNGFAIDYNYIHLHVGYLQYNKNVVGYSTSLV